MFWFAYAKATINTLIAKTFQREIKFKTTEKSILASTVTDVANKAKVKVGSSTGVVTKAWRQVRQARLLSPLFCIKAHPSLVEYNALMKGSAGKA